IAYRALTGELPFGDTHALLRPDGPAPRPSALRPKLLSEHGARELDELVAAMLEVDVGARPETATLVADVLEGAAALPSRALARRGCQSCGAAMPVGQRLCLSCGKLAVQFEHAGDALPPSQRRKLVLRKVKEDGAFMANLRRLCTELSADELPAFNFLVGDARMYSKAERERAIPLPVTLYRNLDEATAKQLAQRFAQHGIAVEVEADDSPAGKDHRLTPKQKRGVGVLAGAGVLMAGVGVMVGSAAGGAVVLPVALGIGAVFSVVGVVVVASLRSANKKRLARWGRSLLKLREAPAALPASDPLVARLAALLQGGLSEDLRVLVSRLALSVQRVVDHRAEQQGAAAEIDLAVSALEPLVAQIEARVRRVSHIDRGLAELDEGRLVRALAASEARGEPPASRVDLLDGLDRLRELEIERAAELTRLAEACDLARRSVELGLRVQEPEAEHERHVRMALQALEG
ncbi:MAG: hypothetical protein KC431_30030, partial [Myxococcales bacterium]|nr:hypothetical protein [Myxococcales bacterium]